MHKLTRRALAATLGVIAVALVVLAPQASANQRLGSDTRACNYDGRFFYACHLLTTKSLFYWDDDALLHLNMPEQYAREVMAGAANCWVDFRASLWGNDGGSGIDSDDDFITDLQLDPGWPRADWSGLEAHLSVQHLPEYRLNEDDDDGEDELYVRISYVDCHTGFIRTFQTDNEVGRITRHS
jgi:hypothetical protein